MESQGFTLWFTGLSGSGKTTGAGLVAQELRRRGMKVEVLDGDAVRTRLSQGLGFSKEDRDRNIRRIGFVCKLLTRNGVVAIAAAISPYREVREENRREIGRFVEVYCECPLEELIRRDVKGLYLKALRGEVANFTGISDPYEPPLSPEVLLHTGRETPEESAAKTLGWLEAMGYIPPASRGAVYSPQEEAVVTERLRALGYF
jgi:adenylyl-sulfate kinase